MRAIPQPDADLTDEVIARDPRMLALLQTAQTIARQNASVLITGETGSGKEVIARTIRLHSDRRARPWIDVNCAALPEHLVESELFGYEKGAFSGADSLKPGLFELASGGTLFLDEIGEIDPKVQVKLLRVLDGAPYFRLGGSRKVIVDVRVVSATNRNLETAVQSGTFRSDLYHRISELPIAVPPLRERPQDIVALAEHFLAQKRPEMSFTPGALELLSRLEWPGNVRELRNLIFKLSVLSPRERITADDVRHHHRGAQGNIVGPAGLPPEHLATMSELERFMIVRTLHATGGNQSLAAEQLGIPRRTFCRKLNQYNIAAGRRNVSSSSDTHPLPANYRAMLNVPVLVRTKDGLSFTAVARNLSVGGLGLQDVQTALAISDEVVLTFKLPGSFREIKVDAIVAWCGPGGTAGTQFTQLRASIENILRNWIAESAQKLLPPSGGTAELRSDLARAQAACSQGPA